MSAPENQLQIDVLLPEVSHLAQKTTTEQLKGWIKEGKLRPTHQIRIKNLPWVEAQNIPILKPLFEAKLKADQERLIESYNQFSQSAPAFDYLKNKAFEAAKASSKIKISSADFAHLDEPEKPVEIKQKKAASPSIPFKLYEQRALARTQQNEAETNISEALTAHTDTKAVTSIPGKSKKSVYMKRVFGYIAGCFLMLLLSYGGAYVWIYQLKAPVEINEKNFPELMNLTHKLTADKLDLRLKTAEKEKEMKSAIGQEQFVPPTDISAEIVKLENQYKNRRVSLVEQHRAKLRTDDFNTTFYFSLSVLLSLFLITNVFVGKRVSEDGEKLSGKKPETKTPEVSEISELDEKSEVSAEKDQVFGENSSNIETIDAAEIQSPKPEVVQSAKLTNSVSASGKNTSAENNEAVNFAKAAKCLLHQEKNAAFKCKNCANNFCEDCVVIIEEVENCCPFCKITCTAFETETAETADGASENNKKNLFDLGKNIDNGRRIFREKRTNKVGVVPALVISLLFSCAISIFWVYKLTPYLENRANEAAQNTSAGKNVGAETLAPANAQTNETGDLSNNANVAQEPCIDPQTRQPFECDQETRNALYEHTRKIKSVEKAQKDTAEKTDNVLGLVMPASENASAENPLRNPADEARKDVQKQQLIKVFSCSFLTIFGLLMAVRILSSEKNEAPEETDEILP